MTKLPLLALNGLLQLFFAASAAAATAESETTGQYFEICRETLYEKVGYGRLDVVLGNPPPVTEKQFTDAVVAEFQKDRRVFDAIRGRLSSGRIEQICLDYPDFVSAVIQSVKREVILSHFARAYATET